MVGSEHSKAQAAVPLPKANAGHSLLFCLFLCTKAWTKHCSLYHNVYLPCRLSRAHILSNKALQPLA